MSERVIGGNRYAVEQASGRKATTKEHVLSREFVDGMRV